ncbi:hypothetical protein ABZ499_34280 [Streptomyces sp. NPDC019990]|uniref:hypothetical protein n=1 Tax=Streptomyces sp. NPDC019990 TaxID=3154693 RepID=UPI0033CBF496
MSVDGQPDIRRLRKPSKVEKAITCKGRVSDIADDHSVQTFHRHYAHGTTWRVIAGGCRRKTAETPLPLPTDAPASSARSLIWRRAT